MKCCHQLGLAVCLLVGSQAGTLGTAKSPSGALDLSHWKLTLPVNASGTTGGKAAEIPVAQLAGGSMMGKPIDTTPEEIAKKGIPRVDREAGITPADMHRYVYSLPVSVLISGCRTVAELNSNIDVLESFDTLSTGERQRLVAATKPFAGLVVENYKRML